MTQLVIRLLGPLDFTLDQQPLTGLDYDKVRALLLTLALAPERAHTRQALCALFWPDLPEKAARNNLSQALTHLRKALPAGTDQPFVLASTASLQVNPAGRVRVTTDVHMFEALIEQCERHAHHDWHTCAVCADRLRQAMQLYRGDFLAEFSLPDSAPFEEWAQARREHLHQLALTALDRLTRAHEWRGQLTEAIDCARRQVALDPLNEASQRELIRLLARDGQLAAARDQYNNLRRALDLEVGVEPEAATESLAALLNPEDASRLPVTQAPPSRMPAPPAALIGRDGDVGAACRLVRDDGARLITFTGPAGVGKTRLALAVAEALRFDFNDGVLWLELAPLTDASDVAPALAQALGLQDETPEAVLTHLRRKHLLLVLDNVEHVLAAAEFIAALIAGSPALTVLATSRAALRIRSERQFVLDPLTQSAAQQLFLDRARALRFDFATDPEAQADVAALCQPLDGLPLAIELVAARVDVFTLAELARQIARQLPAFDDGPRDLPERHRTLHAAIDWSVRLLDDAQRDAFARLAVFSGGFDQASADVVCPGAARELPALVRGSLIQPAGADRWRMLEPMRQFGEQMMAARGELQAVKTRYGMHFVEVAESMQSLLLGPHAVDAMSRLGAEHANLQATFHWALNTGQPGLVLRMGRSIFRYWFRRGLWSEGLNWLEQALAVADATVPIDVRVAALRAAGVMAHQLGLYARADQHYLACQTLAYTSEDESLVSLVFNSYGILRKDQGRFDEALAFFDKAIAHLPPRELKFPWQSKADTLLRLGRHAESKAYYEKAMALNREIGDDEGLAHTLRGLAEIARRAGDADTAERMVRENEVICRKLDHARGLSWTMQLYGELACLRGDFRAAHAHLDDALARMGAMGDAWGRCEVLAAFGHLAVAEGDCAAAARHFDQAQSGWRALGANLTPYEVQVIAASLAGCPG